MKIAKIIVLDDENKEIEFNINDGAGIFMTEEGKRLILPSANNDLNMDVLRSVLSKWQ